MSRWRYSVLLAIAIALVLAVALHKPIPQDPRYHNFADQRVVLSVPNFWNVVSNLPFLLAGVAGLAALRKNQVPPLPYPAYALFFAGAILISFGSAYYHLAPDNRTLVWDRLPMTFVFMALAAIIVGEHISAQLGRRCLPFLVLLGLCSVLYWHFTDDLRPYVLVQFLPMVLLPLIVLLFPSPLSNVHFIWGTFGSYAVAKILEVFDERTYAALRILSGHTLKHVIAAAAIYFLVLAVRRRSVIRIADAAPA